MSGLEGLLKQNAKTEQIKLGMVVYAQNFSTQEALARRSIVQGQPCLPRKFFGCESKKNMVKKIL
jgi:hypothetical protein